jgi:hypothetical protein
MSPQSKFFFLSLVRLSCWFLLIHGREQNIVLVHISRFDLNVKNLLKVFSGADPEEDVGEKILGD